MTPTAAAKDAIERIADNHPNAMVALIVANAHGDFGS